MYIYLYTCIYTRAYVDAAEGVKRKRAGKARGGGGGGDHRRRDGKGERKDRRDDHRKEEGRHTAQKMEEGSVPGDI
jgi:hypothetical protein